MKKKQVFKTVAIHLLKQNEVSTGWDGNQCMYRSDEGISCAIGTLIDDDKYYEDLEGKAADAVEVIQVIEKSLDTKLTKSDRDLLCKLQNIHDYASVESWYEELEYLAMLTFAKTLEDLGVKA